MIELNLAIYIRSSSEVEQVAVNYLVSGSNPFYGVKKSYFLLIEPNSLYRTLIETIESMAASAVSHISAPTMFFL